MDRLGKDVSIIGQGVYHIEANPSHEGISEPGFRGQRPVRTVRGNALAAHDLLTGKRLLRIGRDADASQPLAAVQFVAAPVECLGRLIVPVRRDGKLSLVALNPADGSIAWQRPRPCQLTPRRSSTRTSVAVGTTWIWNQGGRSMLTEPTIEKLKSLHLHTMAAAWLE